MTPRPIPVGTRAAPDLMPIWAILDVTPGAAEATVFRSSIIEETGQNRA
jgi:hypothetical protein